MRTPITAGFIGLLLLGQAVAAPPTPEQRFSAALKTLSVACKDMCGFGLGDNPAEVKALDALWDATQDWTLVYLETRPGVALDKLNADLKKRHPDNRDDVAPTQAVAVAPDLYAFAAQWNETGTVFLVGKRSGQWAVVWDIRKADPGKFAMLKAWHSEYANAAKCEDRFDCGPLYGRVYALAPDSKNRPRFAVRAAYAQMMGATVSAQISFWRWDGDRATALLADRFGHMAEDTVGDFRPDRVTLRVKGEYQSFMACGACVGRQLDWTFRILPDRIVDEGKKPTVPELDAVDAVLARYLHGRPVFDLASPAARTVLGQMFAYAEGASDNLGLEGDRKVTPTKTGADICLATDGFTATHFLVERRGSGFWLADVRRTKARDCTNH